MVNQAIGSGLFVSMNKMLLNGLMLVKLKFLHSGTA